MFLIFQFDEHDKFIKTALAVNHSGREEVLTMKPKDIILFLRLLWPMNLSVCYVYIVYLVLCPILLFTLRGVIFTFYFNSFNFLFLGLPKPCLNMRYK